MNQHTLTAEQAAVGESGRAARVAGDAFPRQAKEVVLVQSRTMTAGDPAFRATIADVIGRLRHTGIAQRRPTQHGLAGSPLGARGIRHSGRRDDDPHVGGRTAGGGRAAAKSHPGFVIAEYGDASSTRGIMEALA